MRGRVIATFKKDVLVSDARDLAKKLGLTLSVKWNGKEMRTCLYKVST